MPQNSWESPKSEGEIQAGEAHSLSFQEILEF